MRMRPKEILKNKSDKMIDLIADEVIIGGDKELTASFMQHNFKYTLSVKIEVIDVTKPVETEEDPEENPTEEVPIEETPAENPLGTSLGGAYEANDETNPFM